MIDEGKRLCGISSHNYNIGTCELEWGHPEKLHSNAGGGFYARDWDEEHSYRQQLVKLMKLLRDRRLHFKFSSNSDPDVTGVWLAHFHFMTGFTGSTLTVLGQDPVHAAKTMVDAVLDMLTNPVKEQALRRVKRSRSQSQRKKSNV